jgi:hypothetical protein
MFTYRYIKSGSYKISRHALSYWGFKYPAINRAISYYHRFKKGIYATFEVLTAVVMKSSYLVGVNPCGGGVEYLHRDPASRKGRRNGTKKGCAIA